MAAYANWWLADARGEEPAGVAPVKELEDPELRELADAIRTFAQQSRVVLAVLVGDAAWELQKELNRRSSKLRS